MTDRGTGADWKGLVISSFPKLLNLSGHNLCKAHRLRHMTDIRNAKVPIYEVSPFAVYSSSVFGRSNVTRHASCYTCVYFVGLPIPMAERSMAKACGRSLPGVAGSNPVVR